MTARFSLPEILSLSGASASEKTVAQFADCTFSLTTDTRQAAAGQFYLAIKGERFDGHDFVAQAALAGADGAIISSGQKALVEAKLKESSSNWSDHFVLIDVPDSLRAYQQLATLYRRRIKPVVVAVTGSSGKTTTKEMCAAVFGASRTLHKSAANENNEVGVPKTILSMPENTQILVLEMGMRGLGQIAELAECGEPDIGIITGVGVAHIELLGSRENIARAKCELLPYLTPETGVAILGQSEGLLVEEAKRVYSGHMFVFPRADFHVVKADAQGSTFSFGREDDVALALDQYTVHTHGSVLLQDAWCAVQAGLCAGLSPSEVAQGLALWSAVEGRGNAVATASGALLIDEAYNSNPDSVRCAIEAICSEEAFPQPHKIVVLGEMLELGDYSKQLHTELGEWLKDKRISTLVTVGEQAKLIADGAEGASYRILAINDREEAETRLKEMLVKDSLIMVKGSHGTKLYELVKTLM
jgi:UDP-N-acetylmuramoyl-tripeptide--D-alanyl-D-alanine ligase